MPSTSSIKQNLLPNEPSLIDLLHQYKKDILLDFNCHHIGTIQVFNALTQTASVTINYVKTFFTFNELTGLKEASLVNYPILAECPCIILGGGNGALTFPIQTGDECLVLFNDRDLDNWFTGGTGSPNATARLHSYSDAVALVGLRSLAHVLPAYDTSRVVLRNGLGGTTMVGVGPALVKIANTTTTLNTLLQSLVSILKSLKTIPAAVGSPLTLDPTVIAQLAQLGTQIGALLE